MAIDLTKKVEEPTQTQPETKELDVSKIVEEVSNKVKTEYETRFEELRKASEENLKKAVQSEKTKLYDSLEKEKKEKKALENKLEELLKNQPVKTEDKKEDTGAIEAKLSALEKQREEDRKRFEEILSKTSVGFQEELKKRDLEALKFKLIAEANNEVIPEIITGNSVEELKESFEKAKLRYKEVEEKSKKTLLENLIKEGKIPEQDVTKKTNSGQTTKVNASLQDIFTMSAEEFEKYKDVISKKTLGG